MIPSEELDKLTADARQIIADTSKVLVDVVPSWQLKGNYYRMEMQIEHNLKTSAILDILVQVNRTDPTIFSFVFRRNRLKSVARYCPDNSKYHKNRLYNTHQFRGEKHKHIWTMLGDREKVRGDESHYAYAPQDNISGTKFEKAFPTFIEECNIRLPDGFTIPNMPTETMQDDIFLYP